MEHRRLLDDAWIYNTHLRAEDGSRAQDQQNAFHEFVIVPLGFLGVIVLIVLLLSHSALAQAGSGRIAGSVKDTTGALISGTSVTLVNTATGATQKTTSDGEGVFNFPVVPVGQYEIDVTADGFSP